MRHGPSGPDAPENASDIARDLVAELGRPRAIIYTVERLTRSKTFREIRLICHLLGAVMVA